MTDGHGVRTRAGLDAKRALSIAHGRPKTARALAAGAVRRGEAEGDPEAVAVAEHALGLAARELDDIPAAGDHLRRSVAVALDAGLDACAARARMTLSLVLAYAGDSEEALRQADLAGAVLKGGEAGRLRSQRGLILQRLGRADEALREYRRALRLIRRAGDTEAEARLLTNRGILRAYRGELRRAENDLTGAERRHIGLSRSLDAAKVRHNLGIVAARRGDFPAAFECFDAAVGECERAGITGAVGQLDRCEALLSARLVADARRVGEAAAAQLEASGMEADLAEAKLLLAQASLLEGDVADSTRHATEARRSFERQGRKGWAALAGYALVRASWFSGDTSERARLDAEDAVRELTEAGWAGPALDARLIAGRMALACGRLDEAEAHLRRASRARRSGPVDVRARAWHATALLRHARGDQRGTETALRAGVRLLAGHRAILGATELRVHAAAHAEDLAELGIGTALESRRADRVLAWAERFRAGALLTRPARPPADADVAEDLAALRTLVSQVEGAAFGDEETGPLLRRQAALEEEIRRKTWHARGDAGRPALDPPSVAELSGVLGDAALVEFLESGDRLHAVCVADERATLHPLGGVEEVVTEVRALRFALGRLARRRGSAASRRAAVDSLRHSVGCLNDLLLMPLEPETGDRPLVVVPTGPLHALPWSTLPSCRGRPVSVCPSAALWLRASAEDPGPPAGRAVLVAGPDLPNAAGEVSELERVYPRGSSFAGAAASTANVTSAANGASLLHVAAHGTFRADNPLFSSLQLADGPLTVYDLEAVPRAPRHVVLSACDAGLSAVRPGAELMGLTAALLSLGSKVLVASVVPVADEVTRPLMLEVHRRLATGTRAAESLSLAQATLGADGGEELASTGGFVCFGAG